MEKVKVSLNKSKFGSWARRPKKYSNIHILSRRRVGKRK